MEKLQPAGVIGEAEVRNAVDTLTEIVADPSVDAQIRLQAVSMIFSYGVEDPWRATPVDSDPDEEG